MHMSIAAFVHFLDISDKSIHFRGAGLDYWSYPGGRVPYGVTAHGCHIAHRVLLSRRSCCLVNNKIVLRKGRLFIIAAAPQPYGCILSSKKLPSGTSEESKIDVQ